MKNSFASLSQNILTRKFGGSSNTGAAEPYVTGYHFIWFDKLPDLITSYTADFSSGISSVSEIQQVLAATCLSVTPPGGTLNKVEFTGLGGVKWAVPGNIDYGNTVSIKFFEFQRTPLLDIFHGWFKMIRDYRTGVSDKIEAGDEGYTKADYGAVLYYWTTAPDARTIEYCACYDGVFPTKDPQDLFTSDVETVGKLDLEMEFSVDYTWHEKWVTDKCKGFVNGIYNTSRGEVVGYKES